MAKSKKSKVAQEFDPSLAAGVVVDAPLAPEWMYGAGDARLTVDEAAAASEAVIANATTALNRLNGAAAVSAAAVLVGAALSAEEEKATEALATLATAHTPKASEEANVTRKTSDSEWDEEATGRPAGAVEVDENGEEAYEDEDADEKAPAHVTPNENCRRDHGPDQQKVTPKGVRYCRICYKEARQARQDKLAADRIAAGEEPPAKKTRRAKGAPAATVLSDGEVELATV